MDAPRHKQSKQRHAAAEGASMPSAALPSLSATSQAHPSAPPLQGSFQARPPSAPPLQGSLGLQAPAVTQPGVSLAHQQPEGQEEEGEEEEEEGSLLSVQQGGDELGTQQEGLQPVAPIGALPTTAGGPSSGLPNRVQQQQEQQGEEAGLSPAARPAAAGPFFPSGRHSSSRGPPANAEEGKEAAGLSSPAARPGKEAAGLSSPAARPAAAGPFFPSGRHNSRGPPATAERVGRASARLGRVPHQMQQLQSTLGELVRGQRGAAQSCRQSTLLAVHSS